MLLLPATACEAWSKAPAYQSALHAHSRLVAVATPSAGSRHVWLHSIFPKDADVDAIRLRDSDDEVGGHREGLQPLHPKARASQHKLRRLQNQDLRSGVLSSGKHRGKLLSYHGLLCNSTHTQHGYLERVRGICLESLDFGR